MFSVRAEWRSHCPIFVRKIPAEIDERLIHAFGKSFLDSKEQQRAQDRLGGRRSVASFGLITPTLYDVAVPDHTASTDKSGGKLIENSGIQLHLFRSARFP